MLRLTAPTCKRQIPTSFPYMGCKIIKRHRLGNLQANKARGKGEHREAE